MGINHQLNHAFTRHKGVLLCHNANSVVRRGTEVAVPIALLENTNMMPIMTTVNSVVRRGTEVTVPIALLKNTNMGVGRNVDSVVQLVTAVAAPIALLENMSTKSLT